MRPRIHALKVCALGAVLAAAGLARAQCDPRWLADPDPAASGLNGTVYAAATWDPDGAGPLPPLLVLGGFFTAAGLTPANNVAAWDGVSWHALGAGTNDYVFALAVYNGQLIAGGSFTAAGSTAAGRAARWDGATWQPLGGGLGDASSSVLALAVYNGELIAGGDFITADGMAANRVARWDGAAWHPLDAGTNGAVYALTAFDNRLVAGGDFTTAGGISARRVAGWDGAAWQPLGLRMGASVGALTVYNDQLIAGGNFTSAGGNPSPHWARWINSPCCLLDYDLSGSLDGDDLSTFISHYFTLPALSGLDYTGYATPAEIAAAQALGAPEPYFTNGYTVDYDQTGEVDPDDLSTYIADFFDLANGCFRG